MGFFNAIGMTFGSEKPFDLDPYWIKLTFDDIEMALLSAGINNPSNVNEWNTFFTFPNTGNPFSKVVVGSKDVTLYGKSNIEIIPVEDSNIEGTIWMQAVQFRWNIIELIDNGFTINTTPYAFGGDFNMYAPFEKLISIELPGLTEISDYLFWNCIGLSSINISEGVTTIGQFAFNGCTSLKTINMYPINAPIINATNSFGDYAATLHIKAGSIGYDVLPWIDTSKFTSIIQDL